MAEFNSFRRVGLILVTVPLAAAGVVPGLLVSGQPFGFMSLLGVFALVGIVVNNAIVLLELVEQQRRAGAGVEEALEAAIDQRIRPILLTSATTVAGLLPLAFSQSTLWPPLAWSMISGLIASTALTLVVVPALYRVIFRPRGEAPGLAPAAGSAAAVTAVLAALLVSAPASASDLDFIEALRRGAERPAAQAAVLRATAVERRGLAERRASYLPTLGGSYAESNRDRDLELRTPIGSFQFGASRAAAAGFELSQPLFDPARALHGNAASKLEAEASRFAATRTRDQLVVDAGEAYLNVLAIEADLAATGAFAASLSARLAETEARVGAGRALDADALKIRLALESAELEQLALEQALEVARLDLGRAIGEELPVEAGAAPDWFERAPPDLDAATAMALAARPDVAALEAQAAALDQRRAAVGAERIPRLDARVLWNWSDGSPYTEKSWTEGALVLTWSPFAAGTRAPRAAALAAETDAARNSLTEARRGVELELRQARARLLTARAAVEVSARGVEQASETARVERERNAAGRATTNDLIQAEAELRDQRTRLELARLEVVRAWLRHWLAVGDGDLDGLLAS